MSGGVDGQLVLSSRAGRTTLLLPEFLSSILLTLLVHHWWAGYTLNHCLGCRVYEGPVLALLL